MNIDQVITPGFKEELINNINAIGIPTSNIECILLEGSALYLKQPNDLDFKVILKRYMPKAETMRSFDICNHKVECCYYTFNDWANVYKYKKDAQYITESSDMICIYGDDSKFVRHDVVNNKELQKYVLNVFDKNFFNYKEENKNSYKMDDKRLWNFLLFAFKVKNKSNNLTAEQLIKLQMAHDLKIGKESHRLLFNELVTLILN